MIPDGAKDTAKSADDLSTRTVPSIQNHEILNTQEAFV
jgi:hypothetical protein